MNEKITVDIIIPTYKRSNTLRRAVESALKQTFTYVQVIVVDDNDPNSEERKLTENLMRSYEDNPKIKYIKHEKNLKGAAARNTGIKNSNGYYIAFLDDDDEFLPYKIDLQVKRLESLDNTWGMCYTNYIRQKNGKLIDTGAESYEGYIGKKILEGSLYISAGSNIMIKREIVEKINGFNEKFLRRQDLEFVVRASEIAKAAFVPEICTIINKDDRSNELLEEGLIENIETYLEQFSDFINGLTPKEKVQIKKAQYLLLVRYYLTKLQIIPMIKTCIEHEITFFVFVRYVYYLAKRRILKQCYGFKI